MIECSDIVKFAFPFTHHHFEIRSENIFLPSNLYFAFPLIPGFYYPYHLITRKALCSRTPVKEGLYSSFGLGSTGIVIFFFLSSSRSLIQHLNAPGLILTPAQFPADADFLGFYRMMLV